MRFESIFPDDSTSINVDESLKDCCPNCGYWLNEKPRKPCRVCGVVRHKFIQKRKRYEKQFPIKWFGIFFIACPLAFIFVIKLNFLSSTWLGLLLYCIGSLWLGFFAHQLAKVHQTAKVLPRPGQGLLGILHDEADQIFRLKKKRLRVLNLAQDVTEGGPSDIPIAADLGVETVRALDRTINKHERIFRRAQLHLLANRLAYLRKMSVQPELIADLADCAKYACSEHERLMKELEATSAFRNDLIPLAKSQGAALASVRQYILKRQLVVEAASVGGLSSPLTPTVADPNWEVLLEMPDVKEIESEYARLNAENRVEDEFGL